jgi:thiol-disulfide isomerase/thioredoxin
MRVVRSIVVGVSLLCITSCSETAQEQADDRPVDHAATVELNQSDHTSAHGDQLLASDSQKEHAESGHRDGDVANANQSHSKTGHAHGAHQHGRSHHQEHKPDLQGLAIGEKVPDFTVTLLNGKTSKLSELQNDPKLSKSGVIVLTFWCSFCHSCRHVEQDLDQLAKNYEGQVAVIALDASAGETAKDVAEFAKRKGLTLPIVLDPGGKSADIFGNKVTTTSIVIDSHGVLRYRGQFGHGTDSFAANALKAVLAGQEVSVKETPLKG